jgi:hypothetical protein
VLHDPYHSADADSGSRAAVDTAAVVEAVGVFLQSICSGTFTGFPSALKTHTDGTKMTITW